MATLSQHTKALLDLMPVGMLLENKYDTDTNIYKFWKAVAMYYVLIEADYELLVAEFGIQTTEYLISEWESEFGIPDDVFEIASTLQERRDNVLLKKSGLNIINIDEFRAIATRLGYTVEIQASSSLWYPPFDVPFYPFTEPECHFIIVIRGDFDVQNIAYLAAFFAKLLPINVGLLLIDTD